MSFNPRLPPRSFLSSRLALFIRPGAELCQCSSSRLHRLPLLLLCPPVEPTPPKGDREHTLLVQSQQLGIMSYMKKDEDADQVMIKLDRTSVFQDGKETAR